MLKALTTLLLLSAPASAATWGLRWSAPPGCIDAPALERAVEARLGKSVFGFSPDLRITGTLAQGEKPKWRANLALLDASDLLAGAREIESDAADCHALDEKLVLVIAVMIEPELLTQPRPPKTQAPLPPPSLRRGGPVPVKVRLLGDAPGLRLAKAGAFGLRYVDDRGEPASGPASCPAPCDRTVADGRDGYFVEGDGFPRSERFTLAEQAPAVQLSVRPGSTARRAAGLALTITAGVCLSTAATLLPISALVGPLGGGNEFLVGSAITFAATLLFAAVGLPLWLTSDTAVRFEPLVP